MGLVCDLEDDLIPPKDWARLYGEMPEECQKVVMDDEELIGIGRNAEIGWFIMCGGPQEPFLVWSEKGPKPCPQSPADEDSVTVSKFELDIGDAVREV
jgi:hypothetical protein